MKLFSRATVTGTTLPGATLKSSLTTLWDALKTLGLSDGNRTTVISTSTLATTQCGLLLVDCTSGNVTLTLPTSGADTDDAVYNVRRIDSSANTLTIQRGGSDTIEGATAGVTLPAGGILGLQMPAGGTNWRVTNTSAASPNTQAQTAFTTSGTAPAYTVTAAPAVALTANTRLQLTFHASTSGAATLAANGLTPKSLKQYDSAGAKVDPVIVSGQKADVVYDGTDFVILDALPVSISTATESAAGKVELADPTEAAGLTDLTRAISPGRFGVAAAAAMNASGAAPMYACRAWVNFNGTGTIAIRAAGNVGSLTDNSTADYTANITTALPDANYATSLMSDNSGGDIYYRRKIISQTASSVRVYVSGTPADDSLVCISIHR